jgi:hypothetical protein
MPPALPKKQTFGALARAFLSARPIGGSGGSLRTPTFR